MVWKASDDLPEPLSPVTTVRVLRGISTSMFLRLCWRAPRTEILVIAIWRLSESCPLEPRMDCPSVTSTGLHTCLTVGVHSSTPYFTTARLAMAHPGRH